MNSATFVSIPVPAVVVEMPSGRFVARAFHGDGTWTDSIEMTQRRAAKLVKALAGRK